MRSLLLLALVACGPKTVTTPVATPSAPVGDIATVKTEAEALWNERGEKASAALL